MPRNITLTPQDKEYLREQLISGRITRYDFPTLARRMELDPNAEGALKRAVENTEGVRIQREIEGVRRVIEDPSLITDNIREYYEQEGILKGTARIGLEAFVGPVMVLHQSLSGQQIETPLQSAFEVASLGLMGLRGGLALGSGLARTPRTAARLVGMADNPALKWGSRITETGEVVAAGEEAWRELAGEALISGPVEVATRRSRRARELDFMSERQASGVIEINPTTGAEVAGKKDRERGRRRRAYQMPDGSQVVVERTATGNRNWRVTMPDGTVQELDDETGVFGFESAFSRATVGGEPSADETGIEEESEEEAAPPADGAGAPAQAEEPSGEVDSGVEATPTETEQIEDADADAETIPPETEETTSPERRMVETRGTWAGLPVIIQGVVEDGTVTDIRVTDGTGDPMSHSFNEDQIASFRSILQASIDSPDTIETDVEEEADAEADTTAEETTETEETEEMEDAAADTEDSAAATDETTEETGGDPEQRVEASEDAVQRVIASSTGVSQHFLNTLYAQLRGGTPTYVIGKQLIGAAEAAMYAYATRNPNVEKVTAFFVRDGEVVGYSLQSLNSRFQTEFSISPRQLRAVNADNFIVVHNHPGGDMTLSDADRSGFEQLRENFGDQFAGAVIIDTDVYTKVVFDENGGIQAEENVPIDYSGADEFAKTATDIKEATKWITLVVTDANNEVVWFMELERGIEGLNDDAMRAILDEALEDYDGRKIDLIVSGTPVQEAVENLSDAYVPSEVRTVWLDGAQMELSRRDLKLMMPNTPEAEIDRIFDVLSQRAEEQSTDQPPEVQMPDDVADLSPAEQMARLHHAHNVLMEWVNENQDGEPSPDVVEVLEILGERMNELNEVLVAEQQAIEAAEEAEDDQQQGVEQTGEDTTEEGTPGEGETTPPVSTVSGTSEVAREDAIAPNAPTAEGRFAFELLDRLRNGEATTDFREFYALADAAWGDTRENGAYTENDAYDVAELAGNLYILEQMQAMDQNLDEAKEAIHLIREGIENRLPSQTVRTQGRMDRQQYSTPFSYAFAVNWIANISEADTIIEPSAGNGNLAVYGEGIGADVHVNEIDEHRQAMLRLLGFENVTAHNAEHLDNMLDASVTPTVVVMNPPFSQTAQGTADNDAGPRHVLQALYRLAPGGRLVAIVGGGINPAGRELGGLATDSRGYRSFWNNAKREASLRANIHVDGKVYQRFGTPYDTRVIVFDKPIEGEPNSEGALEGSVQTVEELVELLEGVRNERTEGQTRETDTTEQRQPPAEPGERSATDEVERGSAESVTRTGTDTGGAGSAGGGTTRIPTGGDPGETGASVGGEPEAGDAVSDALPGGQDGDPSGGTGEGSGEPTGRITDTDRDNVGQPDGERRTDPARRTVDVEGRQEEIRQASKENLTFASYETTTATMPANAKPHPTPLDETVAMAEIPLPDASYVPDLPAEIIESGALSVAQLETPIYAGQAHEQFFTDASGNRVRGGFFNGDGTGVGKGRQIASVILDNERKGRKRAIWITKDPKLYADAQRDMLGIGMDPKKLVRLGKFKTDNPIKMGDGVLFVTYGQIHRWNQTRTRSRLDQIIEWLGPDFDGVIAFDEAHNMGNARDFSDTEGDHKASKTGIAGRQLQDRLPNARIMYFSATGATKVSNLMYAERLGLWGQGTAFPTATDFANAMTTGGIAAMEVVAKDLKAQGKYIRRSLSYQDVEYTELVHEYTEDQIRAHNEMGDLWREVFANLAVIVEGMRELQDLRNLGRFYANFYSNQLRFYNALFTTQKLPTLIKQLEEDIENGYAPVIQIITTMDAAATRMVESAQQNNIPLERLTVTPKAVLERYLREAFPIYVYETIENEDGTDQTVPVRDGEGNPIVNRRNQQIQEELLNRLYSLQVDGGALDEIIAHFGVDNVAEVTGRENRLIWKKDGTREWQSFGEAYAKKDASDFMNDKKKLLIFSRAGGEGASYHADLDAKNQRLRRHYVLDPGWSAKDAIQGMGRTHRSNQAQAPEIILVRSDMPGEKRFYSTIARRLDQLGALTSGDRTAASGDLMRAEDNLETRYGREALQRFMQGIVNGSKQVFLPTADGRQERLTLNNIEQKLALSMRDQEGAFSLREVPPINRFLNRLLALSFQDMEIIFNAFIEDMTAVMDQHRQEGTLDIGLETINAISARQLSSQTVFSPPNASVDTQMETIEVTQPYRKQELHEVMGTDFARFVQSSTGKVYAESQPYMPQTEDIRRRQPMVRWTGPGTTRYVRQDEARRSGRDLGEEATENIRQLWQNEYDALPDTRTQNINLLTGMLLPVWNRLPDDTSPMIRRVFLDDDTSRLGLWIDDADMGEFGRRFGVTIGDSGQMVQQRDYTAPQVFEAIVEHDQSFELANGWVIRKINRMDADWIEIEGPNDTDMSFLNSIGVESRRVGGVFLHLIHTGQQGLTVLEALIAQHRVVGPAQAGPRRITGGGETPPTPTGTPPDSSTPPSRSVPSASDSAMAQAGAAAEQIGRAARGLVEDVRQERERQERERQEEAPEAPTITRQDVENASMGLNVGTAATPEVLEQIYGRLNVEQMQATGRSGVLWTEEQKPAIIAQIRDIQLQRTGEGVQQLEEAQQRPTTLDEPSVDEMLTNALRATSGSDRVNPVTGRLHDVVLDAGTLREVTRAVKKVVPEATITLPKESISFEGEGKRGSGDGLMDRLMRILHFYAPVIAMKIEAWTPVLRQRLRELKAEVFSGIAALDAMGEPGAELRDILQRSVRLTKYMENMSRRAFVGTKEEPGPAVLFDRFTRERYKAMGATEESLTLIQEQMGRQIWAFIEDNEAINDPELLEIAQAWKEVWREEYRKNVHFMIDLQNKMEAQGYSLDIVNRRGKRKKWRPLSAEFGWSAKQKKFTKGRGKNIRYFEIDEAIDQMTKLWTPHYYPPRHWENQQNQSEARLRELDALDPESTQIPGYRYVTGEARGDGWQWMEGAEGESRPFFTDRAEAIRHAREQYGVSRSVAMEELAALKQGTPREGHLERERETNDRLYMKKLELLMDMQMRFAQRAGELRFFGQFDPNKGMFGGSPILRQYLERIRNYAADAQEVALREFTKPLLSYDRFAELEGFEPDKPRTAFNAILRWAEDNAEVIDPNRIFADNPDITEDMKQTLVRIGLLRQDQTGDYSMRSFTAMGRILGEYFATVSLRENTAYNIFNGLNMKDSVDPVEMQGLNFWRALNDATTIGTLGVTASIQNIAEMPIIMAMAGNKAAMKGLQQFISDPDFREAGTFLGAAIGQTKEYLSEGGEYTSRWLDFIRFNWTDKLGRGVGVLAGVERVKEDMLAYVEERTAENAERLRDYGVSPKALDEFMADNGSVDRLNSIFTEFDERFKSGLMPVEGVRLHEGEAAADAWTDVIGDEIGRGASFISDASFKQYNRLSLNSLLAGRDPKIRIFLKYQAWVFQQSAHILRMTKRAFAQAAKGDVRSLMWLIATAGTLTTAHAGLRWVYDILQKRDEDKELGDRMIEGFAEAQAAGYISMLMEVVRRSEGSSFQAMNQFMFYMSPPVGTFALRPAAEALTAGSFSPGGFVEGAGAGAKEIIKQTPGGREVRRFFGFVLPPEWR